MSSERRGNFYRKPNSDARRTIDRTATASTDRMVCWAPTSLAPSKLCPGLFGSVKIVRKILYDTDLRLYMEQKRAFGCESALWSFRPPPETSAEVGHQSTNRRGKGPLSSLNIVIRASLVFTATKRTISWFTTPTSDLIRGAR